jgi:GAF domain-containing protein
MDRPHRGHDSHDSPPDQLTTLETLHKLLLTAPEVETFLQEVAVLASRLVSPVASVGITVHYDGDMLTVATSDERAALIDMEQYTVGDGPCLEALRTGEVVAVADQATDTRWDGYALRAREQGVRSTLSLPLLVDGRSVGALNLYSTDRAHAFDDEAREQAMAFADRASVALTLTIRHAEQASTSQQLEQALASRSVIDQAIGMLMAEQRCDARTAFDLLRRHSQNHNRKLREVAEDLITRVSGQSPTPPPPFERDQKGEFGPV